jgi:hypothetical protein
LFHTSGSTFFPEKFYRNKPLDIFWNWKKHYTASNINHENSGSDENNRNIGYGDQSSDWKCPWTPTSLPDCANGKCSLKYISKCYNGKYDDIYTGICDSRESVIILEDLLSWFRPLGRAYEKWTSGCSVGNGLIYSHEIKTSNDSKTLTSIR